MYRDELVKYLDQYLKISEFNDYCQNGMQLEGKPEVKKVGTAVTANLATLEKAAEQGVDLLIVHHGLFWKGDPHAITGTKKKKIELLLKHGISLLTYHLPLDAHPEVGNNWVAARELGWKNLEPYGLFNGSLIGVMGAVEPMATRDFVDKLMAYYEHPAHEALGGKKEIRKAALISGGAYKELGEAAKAGMDCFVTGNFDEPAWSVAFEEGINFCALGHNATEKVGPKALGKHIQDKWSLPASFIDVPNPF